jgi:hypothetical protein
MSGLRFFYYFPTLYSLAYMISWRQPGRRFGIMLAGPYAEMDRLLFNCQVCGLP